MLASLFTDIRYLTQAFAGYLDLRIVALPQEGIYESPGALELMEEGLRLGCAVVGGCPDNEADLPQLVPLLENSRRSSGAVVAFDAHGGSVAKYFRGRCLAADFAGVVAQSHHGVCSDL